MRADAFFAAAQALPYAPLHEITRGGGLLVVAPHPDDESLGCGGLIAAACAAQVDVRLIVVSDGVGSHPNSRRYPRDALRELRETETLAAAAALGLDPKAIRFLHLPDRAVPTEGRDAEAAREVIAGSARACAAGAVCVTWQHDPHCDHVAAADLVARGAFPSGTRVLAYPVWGWTLAPDTEVGAPPRGLRFDISDRLEAKAAAIAAHRSQTTDLIDDDPTGFRLAPEVLAHFARPYEILLDIEGAPAR